MSILQAIILGIVQGITEFFPVSSSAHLYLVKQVLHFPESSPLLDLSCHVGTLFSLCIYLRYEILKTFVSWRALLQIFLALLPLIPFYIFLKPFILQLYSGQYLGYFFCVSALLLFIATKKKEALLFEKKAKVPDVLFIGTMQAIALIPGISRSGATISAARMRGWELKNAVIFSFLLSIPTIIGGFVLELWKSNSTYATVNFEYGMACLSSFCMGLISISFLFKILKKGKFFIFAWYCLILGLVLLFIHG